MRGLTNGHGYGFGLVSQLETFDLWRLTIGSPYALYLGSSARIARLQAEHMRLCLNSYALKAGPDEDELAAQCLKKAMNAAMSTIQTHFESSQTDLALSFATDVSGAVAVPSILADSST
jgi:hypothetical protein